MKECLKFYINGEWVDPVNPQHLTAFNYVKEKHFERIEG